MSNSRIVDEEVDRALPSTMTLRCAYEPCGRLFEVTGSEFRRRRPRYCSRGCDNKQRHLDALETRTCMYCGGRYALIPSRHRSRVHDVCSRECYNAWRRSNRQTREERNIRRSDQQYRRYQEDESFRERKRKSSREGYRRKHGVTEDRYRVE